MKLNLGSGPKKIEGYLNMDGKNGDSLYPLPFKDIEEIRASHVLEHFGIEESLDVLHNWVSCLKNGGVLKIAVPDFDDIMRRRYTGNGIDIEAYIMGGQTDELDYHKSIWTHTKLRTIMERFGLTDIRTWQSEVVDCAALPISLNLMGVKTNG